MTAVTKAIVKTFLLHLKTFRPSRIDKGSRLKTARSALKTAANQRIGKNRERKTKIKICNIFVKGPARAILPIFSLVTLKPKTTTAPGAIILNGERAVRNSKYSGIFNFAYYLTAQFLMNF